MKTTKLPSWLTASLIAGAFGLLLWHERKRPLRREVEPKLTRGARNLAIALVGATALSVTEAPLTKWLSTLVEQRRLGLLKFLRLPRWLEVVAAVVLLDYTLYIWHVLTHRVPLLWRFHVVHHADLDLDASTALRFHFGELMLSAPWRAAQVVLIGVSPLALSVWQTLLLLSILFHHSNVELPIAIERRLNLIIVTPRMHGIHHSIVKEETDSNWSSGLSIWDRLHRTLKLNIPQEQIVIGVPAYREPREVELTEIVTMPFGKQKPSWRLPNNGEPERTVLSAREDRLLP